MKFDTTRFGQIDVKSDDILIFPEGPLGFPDCTRFTLVDEEKAQPFRMLQSLDNPSLAFVVVDPLVVRQDYNFNVTPDDLKQVKAAKIDDLMVYAIVTMATDLADVTVNLQGPLVINSKFRVGHQFVLIDSEYTTREPLIQTMDQGTGQGQRAGQAEEKKQKKAV